MITLTFCTVYIALLSLVSTIDMFIYKQSFLTSLSYLFMQGKGTNEWMINVGVGVGFLYAIAVDYRLKKGKGSQKG
ncbi:hypothetical protein [Bacillus dakarensis]|uniref:hypothetical protein n=1 Tax=Robertmurraya dakarensis TaxID=1926278 RepID=UPI000980DC3A|nr:hypothetical protein [Bacillus dakarensis]